MEVWLKATVLVIVFVVPLVAIFLWIKFFNNSDGERHLRMRMQGPFVPHEEDGNDITGK